MGVITPTGSQKIRAACFAHRDGWYMNLRQWTGGGPIDDQVFGPTASLCDMLALLDLKRIFPSFSHGHQVHGEWVDLGVPATSVCFTVMAASHYGFSGVPDDFLPIPMGRSLLLYDPSTCMIFVWRKGRLHIGPSCFWGEPITGEFRHFCRVVPTTARGWKKLAREGARKALEAGCCYSPVIIPGLERQPWTQDQILAA